MALASLQQSIPLCHERLEGRRERRLGNVRVNLEELRDTLLASDDNGWSEEERGGKDRTELLCPLFNELVAVDKVLCAGSRLILSIIGYLAKRSYGKL